MNTIKGRRTLAAKKARSGAGNVIVNVSGKPGGELRAVVFSKSQAEILKSAADKAIIYYSRD